MRRLISSMQKFLFVNPCNFTKNGLQCSSKKNTLTGMLKLHGKHDKHDKHAKVSNEQKNGVISHIDSFPVIESHYCRAKTNKKIFGSRA